MVRPYTYVVKLMGYGSYIVGGAMDVESAFKDARTRLDALGVKNFDGFTTEVHRESDGSLVSYRRP